MCVTFFEKQLPAFVGKHDFENCIKTKSCPEELPRPPVRTDYTYFGALDRTWNLQNRCEKCVFLVYAPSLEALFAILCSTACILHDIFTFSQCFRHHFAEKWTLLSEFTSHKYGRLTLPARYVVFTCRHDVVLLESPTLNCMLYFATLKLLCRSKIKGRRCCPPQRAFNNWYADCEPHLKAGG